MTESPNPESVINFEGPAGDTLFHRFLMWCLPPEWEGTIQAETDEVFAHLNSEDDRAVALVGAMVVENAVDELVAAYVPGYETLAAKRDFTMSMRIQLARALRLCPSRFLAAADTIRRIRNDFAHTLAVNTFDACEKKHLDAARGHLRQIQPSMEAGKTDREVFTGIVSMVRLALRGYSFHVERLNDYMRKDEAFWTALHKHCLATYPQMQPDRPD